MLPKSQSKGDTKPKNKAKASSLRADEILDIQSKLVIDGLVKAGVSRAKAQAQAIEIQENAKSEAQTRGVVAGFSRGSKHTGPAVDALRADIIAIRCNHTDEKGLIETDGGLKKLGFWAKFTEPDTK